jgi:hypothetical protein
VKEILESFLFSASAIDPERAFPVLERSNLISCFCASKPNSQKTEKDTENNYCVTSWEYHGFSLASGSAHFCTPRPVYWHVVPSFLSTMNCKLIQYEIAWLILSSCLGDNFRLTFSNVSINPRQMLFDRNYLRTVTSSGHGTWNQIEMEDMLGDSPRSSIDSEDRRVTSPL